MSEVIRAVTMKHDSFSVVASYNHAKIIEHFRRMCCLHVKSKKKCYNVGPLNCTGLMQRHHAVEYEKL
jgi:hypothetical protein